jgi:uncharacterized protein YjbI with pentapeptide repeats
MLKKKIFTYSMIALAVILLAGVIMHNSVVFYTVEEINADNSLINGRTLRDVGLTGLHLANITLKNTAFKDMEIYDSDFTNVTFEDCTFSNVEITNSRFNNVIFKDGIMTYSGDRDNRRVATIMNGPVFNNVVFDNVRMEKARFFSVSGSSLTWRNMRDFRDYGSGGPILGDYRDKTINFRVDNCEITDVTLALLEGESTIYMTNSRLKESGFASSECKIIYVENCELNSVELAWPQLLVVKGSTIRARAGRHAAAVVSKAYFVDNKYLPRTIIDGGEVHIFGGNAQASLGLLGGNVYIYDMELVNSIFNGAIGDSKLESVNLRNVKIRGGKWANLKIPIGIWENVEIYPVIKIESPVEISDLKVYNLTFPHGNPFVSGVNLSVNLNLQRQRYDQPFDWPEVHVPTAQELGLTD